MSSLFVGCDAHKHYSQLEVQDSSANVLRRCRLDHARGALASFFSTLPRATPVALESVGNWYWIAGRDRSLRLLTPADQPNQSQAAHGPRQ